METVTIIGHTGWPGAPRLALFEPPDLLVSHNRIEVFVAGFIVRDLSTYYPLELHSCFLHYPFRTYVVWTATSLNPGQPDFFESKLQHRLKGLRRQSLSAVLSRHKVIDLSAVLLQIDSTETRVTHHHSIRLQEHSPRPHTPFAIGLKTEVKKSLGVELCTWIGRVFFPRTYILKIVLAELTQYEAFSFQDRHL